MNLFKIFYIVCCFTFVSLQSNGQQILFRNYSVADGLPSNTVRVIVQDDQEYMWFGTKNGISRFDGYQFKNFQFKNDVAGSLGNNFVNCITRYDSTHLWIGTENGIYILDMETELFTPFKTLQGKTVSDILRDKNGMFWITSRLNGLYKYDPKTNTIINFTAGNSA